MAIAESPFPLGNRTVGDWEEKGEGWCGNGLDHEGESGISNTSWNDRERKIRFSQMKRVMMVTS